MFNLVKKCTNLVKLVGNSNVRQINPVLTKIPLKNFSQNLAETSSISVPENETAEIDYEAIAQGDKELEHKLKVIALEMEVSKQEGKAVPEHSFMTPAYWLEAANLPSRTARRRFFEYLFKLSKKKENKIIKSEMKKSERSARPERPKCENLEEFAQIYDLSHNNIFLRFYETTINNFYNNRLVQAMQYGQKLIIDCSFEPKMSKRENILCTKQLQFLFADNRMFDDPFDVHYCSLDPNGILFDYMERQIPTMTEPWFPINIHQESYLDMFPKERLVYLTPHWREDLVYNHDDIYILGAIVDKQNTEPLSLAKAKREGLRMARLPIDKYIQWGSGSGKNLTLNHMIAILNDVKVTGDWNYAFRHIPRRKLMDFSMGRSIKRVTNDLPRRDEYPRRENPNGSRRWIPASNIDLSQLKQKKSEPSPFTGNVKKFFD